MRTVIYQAIAWANTSLLQWNLSVATTSIIKPITYD